MSLRKGPGDEGGLGVPLNSAAVRDLDEALLTRRVVVCVGPGGVGKTTTSAVIGLRAAKLGRRVLVLTVDPARRLAQSLGMEGLLEEPTQVDPELLRSAELSVPGEFWAMMLDTKRTFDKVIERFSPDEASRDRILKHPYYVQLSTALAGSQEYMAMEKLYELHGSGDFDLLVLDTPPTHHALDFLDAPRRMEDFFDSAALRFVLKSGRPMRRIGFGLMRLNAFILKGVGRFLGSDLFVGILDFLEALAAMSEGFAERARQVRTALTDADAGFIIITGPEEASLSEGEFFRRRLTEEGVRVVGHIVNRVRPLFDWRTAGDANSERDSLEMALGEALGDGVSHARGVVSRLMAYDELARADSARIAKLEATEGSSQLLRVPFFDEDIHDIGGLSRFEGHLFAASQPAAGQSAEGSLESEDSSAAG